jgi:hypothetical protein
MNIMREQLKKLGRIFSWPGHEEDINNSIQRRKEIEEKQQQIEFRMEMLQKEADILRRHYDR